MAEDGLSVVQLDKALYGCVEAAHLSYLMLREKLEAFGFVANPAEPYVLNKRNTTGLQISLTLHVDDLLTTCKSEAEIDLFFAFLRTQFPVITFHKRKTHIQLPGNALRLQKRGRSNDAGRVRRHPGGMWGG